MKKNKKILIIALLLTFIFGVFSLSYVKVHADSGWDSSYDFDFDSGSSWDYSGGGGGGGPIGFGIIVVFIIIIIIVSLTKKKTNTNDLLNPHVDVPIPGFNEEEFLKATYDIYLKTQNAWTEFKYDELQKLLTDELYNSYKSQLKALDLKKQKNLMHDFSLVSNNIKSFSESEKEYTIKTILCVKFYDYVVDNEGKVVRGLKNRRIQMNYELTFVKSKSNKANKCPNCNAPLDSVSSSICPYCRSTIVSDYHDFVLSKKEVINQFLE